MLKNYILIQELSNKWLIAAYKDGQKINSIYYYDHNKAIEKALIINKELFSNKAKLWHNIRA